MKRFLQHCFLDGSFQAQGPMEGTIKMISRRSFLLPGIAGRFHTYVISLVMTVVHPGSGQKHQEKSQLQPPFFRQ